MLFCTFRLTITLLRFILNLCSKGCVNEQVRLVDDQERVSQRSSGIVQLCRNETWHTSCVYSYWSTHAANVVCRQLGYLEYGENASTVQFSDYV